jgi:hypothetical protein
MNQPSASSTVCTLVTIARNVASSTNDPLLWALDDHQVTKSMLLNGSNDDEDMEDNVVDKEGHEEEAKINTELYLSIMEKKS